jgi:hypothetical protein
LGGDEKLRIKEFLSSSEQCWIIKILYTPTERFQNFNFTTLSPKGLFMHMSPEKSARPLLTHVKFNLSLYGKQVSPARWDFMHRARCDIRWTSWQLNRVHIWTGPGYNCTSGTNSLELMELCSIKYLTVVSSNEINVLRYCTWVVFLRSEHVTK